MLLTSWVESMRVAFEKSRKATLNPRRRLQLRSVPSSARQKVQRRIAIEQLEDRTLLTSLIINQLTAGMGVTIDNSVLDPDADGFSEYDSIIFENLTIDTTTGYGVSIDLDGLQFQDAAHTQDVPFSILFDNVSINAASGNGINIELSNLLVDTIAIDSSTITGGVGNAFNVDLTNVTLNEFNIIDSSLSGQAGAGVTVAMSAATIEETSLRRSIIDGVSIDVADGSVLRHTTLADNTISGSSGNDGVSVNIVDSIAEELRLTNNNSIQGVSISVDDTAAGGAALLTELFIHSNNITGNTAGAGISLDLNNVDQFVSITGNSITGNSGDGIVFDQTDGDLSGQISGNNIANNTGHGINFTPSTTNQTPTGGAPGVPAYAGIPGPTDTIDFAAPRNEVQLITFAGVPTGGTFTITYTGGNGVPQTTAGILATATASQVKAAMVAAFDDIGVGDVVVNGNFQDGYEIEFVNAAGGLNVNPLTVDVSGFNSTPASVIVFQDTSANVDETQHIDIIGTPAFGSYQLNFLGESVGPIPYTMLTAAVLQNELNIIANNYDDGTGTFPFSGSPIQVTGDVVNGFDILFLDSGTMHDLNVPQVSLDISGLNLFVVATIGAQGANPNKPAPQTITFQDADGNVVTPSGGSFQLTFQTETTGNIVIDPDPNVTAANIDAALQALFSATTKTGLEGDFIVSGDFTNGFVIEFNEIQHLSMLGSFDPTFGSFQLTFLGSAVTFGYDISIPSAFGAQQIQNALNTIANNSGLGYTGSPVSVTVSGNGYDIIFLDSGSMANADVPQITVDASRMRFDVDVANLTQGNPNTSTNERQTLNFADFQSNFPFTFAVNGIDITNPPIGTAFTLTFQGETTQGIVIDTDPAVTAANIDAALEALSIATSGDDFDVTGDYANGFIIEFQGDFAASNVPLLVADVFPLDVVGTTLVGNFNIATVNPIVGDPTNLEPNVSISYGPTVDGVGNNEIQSILIPNAPGGGTFSLFVNTLTSEQVVLDFDATAAEVQAALESLSSIGVGNVLVTGSAQTGGFNVEFIGAFRATAPGFVLDINDSNILIVVPTVTTIAEGTTINEVQEISVNGTPSAGSFSLTFDGQTTGPINYNADAAAIYTALIALSNLNAGDVLVRGDALTGFEIEFTGNLATVNTPQVVVDNSLLTGALLTVKTTTVGGYLRGISGNTITGNNGAGIEIDLEMYTSFYGDISSNTISSNNAVGINLVAADPTTLWSVDFSLNVDGNTMDDNTGAGIAVAMQDTATGDISITGNTITSSNNDNNASTPYAGDAIYVDLYGTDVSFEAFNQLRDLTIDGNYLGTDASGTAGQGNAGHGVGIHIEESTIIDRTQISNNVIANNTADGISFHREDDARVGRAIVDPIVGEERAVMIYSNTITGNSNGIEILAQNGNLTTTDFEIKDNVISTNSLDGVSLHAEADATIFADIINNQILSNNQNGIEATTRTTSYFGTDRRDIAGTWIQNDISLNGYHGVRVSGRIGNRNMLFIGLDGVDPVTGLDRGNLIEGNARDGIQIAANLDRVQGNVKIANNSILSNSTGGIELLGESLTSSLDNNLIAFNTGKGVDINSNGQTIFMRNNIITENTLDGLEILAANGITHSEANYATTSVGIGGSNRTSLTAIGNFIDNNGGRGVDLQTEGQADSDVIFGDGTEAGANRIVSNALEGFYVVTTASTGQDQDANSTAALDATGSVENSHADMVLQINTNYIQDNGVNSGFSANGLILRIGSMAGEHSQYFSHAPGTDAGTGAEGSDEFTGTSDGRSNVSVVNNQFEGNYGEDVFIESFTSTVDPNTTQDIWVAPTANPPFRVLSSYEGDPLARLNLVFQGNTGNGLNVTNVGAFYNNSEPDFKSRLNNKVAPNPDGPFTSATRRRNAQRVASRTNLAPFSGGPNDAPTAVGTVANAFLSSPGGPIQVTTTGAHGLFSGAIVEITGVRSDELGFSLFSSASELLSPVNGVFYVDVIDAFNFTLRSTDGAILGNVRQNFGTWSYNDNNAFLYPGMGGSTFRIAQGFDGVGNGFQQGDSFLTEINRAGTITGELNFNWDTWVPDDDTFLTPYTSTFLTADISVLANDPSDDTSIGDFIISFTEDVAGVDITDFSLFHDNVDISSLLTSGMLTQIDLRTFRLNIDSILGTEGDGDFELRLNANGTISDSKYVHPISPIVGTTPANYLLFGDVERFTIDTTDPTVKIDNVSPDPRSAAVGELIINFSEDVTGVDLGDFTLVGPDGSVNLAATPATLTQVTGSQFVLDLSKVTSLSGTYTLTINTTVSSSIIDSAGNALTAAGSTASETWVNDTLAPTGTFQAVADGTVSSVDFDFLETVTGIDASDFELYRNGSLVSGGVLSVTGAGGSYTVNLDVSLTSQTGVYTLVFLSEESGVTDASGNAAASSPDAKWNNGTDFTAPTAGIEDVSPDGTSLDLDDILNDVIEIKVAINFSEPVSGVNDNDGVKYTNFVLNYDDGTTNQDFDVLVGTLTDGNGQVIGVTPLSSYLLDLSSLIKQYNLSDNIGDGLYTLKLIGGNGTITDVAGNIFNTGATDTFRIGEPVLQASIQGIPPVVNNNPPVVHTNVGNVSISFDDGITSVFTDGVTLDDFRLTLNGQALDLAAAGVTLTPVGTASTFTLDLSMITQVAGSYELTLVAAGSGITGGGNALLTDESVSWINSSTIDLTGIDPANVDRVDDLAGDGIVGDGSDATVTLRAAIQEANALAGSNTIVLGAGTYLLGIDGIDEDQSATGDLDIRDNLTIRGQGVGVTIIDGGALDRIFQIFAGITLNLENLTITNGFLTGSDDGAGIRNSGTTTLTNVEVTDNHAEDSAGGINNSGLIVIVDSTISNNTAGGSGGGLRNTGTMQISRSTISGNTSARDGGALFNAGAGTATVSNSTFSGNSSDRSGGAIRNTATLTATNNTMTLNDAGTTGGGISNSGTATIQNNLVLANTATTNPELDGTFSSLDGNLIGLVGSATGFGFGDIIDVADPAPVLDLNLADNGGPTLTHALLLGSIAIDAGINANTDALEQRGSSRILGTNVDIGAVEFGAFFVNSTLDTVDANPGDGIAADEDGNLTLRAAIMEANALAGDSVIILGAGTYDLTLFGSGENLSETGDLDITDTTGSLTILGAGIGQTIITAAGLVDENDRVFDIRSGADLTLQGVTITGGKVIGDSGGGIRNVGTLTLINSLVDGNAAEVDVDNISAEVNGGGILNGQLGLQGTLILTNSDVTNNSAVDGGGIFNNDQSQLTIVDSEISGNTASSDGGGIFNDLQASIDILRSSISSNISTEDGGGIYNNDLSSLTITDSKVNKNTADQGGGIFNEEAASLTITRTTVSGNTATQDGGGIYNDEGVVALSAVSILTNTAAGDGGGLYNASAGQITITNGMFDDNTANRDGGAIANFGISLSLNGTIIRDSIAVRNGGGLYNDQEEGTVSLLNTSFLNNVAASGGAINNQELGIITLDLSDLLNNTASANGGAIFNTADGTVTVQRTTLDGNSALNGAGIYNDDAAQLNLINSTVSNNTATNDGGGLFNNSLVLAILENATISGNNASDGAGIYNTNEGAMEITNATVFNNAATSGGGIVNETDGFVSVVNTIIAGNSATVASSDLLGVFSSNGNNLIGDQAGSTGFTDGVKKDQVNVSAGLGALQDNGGATFTHELLGGSLARDAGNNFYAPTEDQRGFARLFDGDGNGSLIVDIGAFESGYIVTSFEDSVDVNPGDGVSVDAKGRSTLRAAIIEANTRTGADTILLGTGTYTLSLFGLSEDGALTGDLDITDDLTIIGAGSDKTFIDADTLDRIFHIFTDVNVSIRGVTLLNGNVTRVEDGGAILNFGNLTLEDVTIESSLANRGGALFNNGTVTMMDSYFHNNTAIADGGAIFNSDYGTLSIDTSTIYANDAENGGGIYNSTGGTLAVNNTTVDGNTATVAGGGIFISDQAAVGNGEGGEGANIPALVPVLMYQPGDAGTDPVYYYDYQVSNSDYELHTSPKYNNGGSEAAILGEAPPFPVGDTFNLSSLPGSNFTIYLDFDGHTTTGTQWNSDFGQVSIVTPAYDTDGNVGAFSLAELEDIQRAWLRVAEDFAPFNINVTTAEPPVSDLIRSGASDTRWGVRVVCGVDTFDLTGTGGLAYLTSFNAGTDTPAFVFNAGLIGVAETISHEVGHTLGLSHDGTSIDEYYLGHGGGATGWAPIMGAGFYENVVQWSSGEYTDADNQEDDLSIITTQNGFSYRADDHGSNIGTASTISDGVASGIIERNTDLDFFQFTTTGGDVIIDPFFESPNLDILATLYDSSGTVIQTSNPIGALNASFIGLTSGTYYVSIEGTGEGDVLGTGYSDYGSLGQYTILVTGVPPTVDVVGNVTISNSTISNNVAGTRGGGLLNQDTVDISNVTFSGNEAGKQGGAIHNTGDMTINNTTIYNNFTEGTGGGIYSVDASASVSVKNTIVAGNNALVSGYDLAGTFTSQGYNLIGSGGTATGFIDGFNGDIVGTNSQRVDPALGILQDNGGPTQTHALLTGSRAIDAGDNTDGVSIDQRGATRPTDTTSDIGAFEIVTPTITIDDVSQIETDTGTVFKFIVSLSNANVDEVTVDFETSNITATAGVDYQFTTGTVTFAAGETTQVIEVVVSGDALPEDHEKFAVNLYNAQGAVLGTAHGIGTILNDEANLIISNAPPVMEGPAGVNTNMNFTVELSHPVTDIVTVDFETLAKLVSGGTADEGIDFVSLSGHQITFDPADYAEGEAFKQIVSVQIIGDSDIEPDENLFVELSNVNSTISTIFTSGLQAEGTIVNDDDAFLSIGDATMVEPEDGSGPAKMRFTLTLSHPATSTLDVDIITTLSPSIPQTSPGLDPATAGTDYQEDDGGNPFHATFNAGENTAYFEVDIYGDSLDEDTEFFYVEITGTAGFSIEIGKKIAIGRIIDDGEGLVVTTTDDELDSVFDPSDLSLREAIDFINNDSTGNYHTIVLPTGDYDLTRAGINEDNNVLGDFDIKKNMTIVGDGSGLTVIDAQDLDRIFHTVSGASLNLSDMTLINGDADYGGAIYAEGDLSLNRVIFQDNNADFLGGAIVSAGQLDITDALFLNNHAGFQGGAIYQYSSTASVGRTTFSGNTSDGRAGAVYVATDASFDVSQSLFYNNESGSRGGAIFNEGTVTSTNVTFSENHAGSRGGAIFNTGKLTLLNNTLTLNTADQTGGGISNDSANNADATAKLTNTIVAGNIGFGGNPDLGGAYDVTSSYNLVGDIGAATGFDDVANGNIYGTLAAPIDAKLGILLDNGGPTKTHSLLFGSPAIDGASGSAPAVDQIGNPRPVDGNMDLNAVADIGAVELQAPPSAPLFGTGGDSTAADENTNIQISVVKQKTTVSSNGHTAALPGNEDWLQEWDTFWVEVWVDTASGFGISDVLTDIAYNTAYFTATSVEFGSNFAFNRTALIDDAAGVVRNLGGSTLSANVGGTGYALLARIKFESLAGDGVDVDTTNLTVEPLQLGLDIQNAQIEISGIGDVTVNVGALPETDLYPVIYDINDSGVIDYRDLIFLTSAYGQNVINGSSPYVSALDFDKSGKIDYRDLIALASNYGKKRGGNTQVNFPTNFGQKWVGNQLEVASGDDSIGQVIEAAVDTWETALGVDDLNVQVIVHDFGTAQLGSGQTTEYNVDGIPVGGRVVIDDDANGLGWHVDVNDLPSGSAYDLYTVLLHEIGHVLGFTRYYSGFGSLVEDTGSDLVFVGSDFTVQLDSTGLHIDDPAYAGDLMNDTLDPGVRKSISELDVKMLLESYASANSGSGSTGGGAAPVIGTNYVPAQELAEPVLIQSQEAAQTFVEQSSMSLAAPAVIKSTEEEDANAGIQQTVTFDVFQPTVLSDLQAADESGLDISLFEDLYSSSEFEDVLMDSDTDDRELVLAHAENDLDWNLADDFSLEQESMDDAFTNWEGPLL